jgi:hypothetical protein
MGFCEACDNSSLFCGATTACTFGRCEKFCCADSDCARGVCYRTYPEPELAMIGYCIRDSIEVCGFPDREVRPDDPEYLRRDAGSSSGSDAGVDD